MILFDDSHITARVSFSEEGDTLIIENNYVFGVLRVNSFSEVTSSEGSGVFFDRSFQYTIDGIHWSEWQSLTNFNLSNINTKYNHLFSIKYRYTRVGQNPSIILYFHSISLSISYRKLPEPLLYENSYIKKYIPYFNKSAIEWSVNVLNKVYSRGIVPKFIERGENINWQDEDYINFWWNIIYINGLKAAYSNIFSNILDYTNLVKKLLIQKDIIPGETNDIGRYYYLLTHYYDEIMKRGSVSIFDQTRLLPENFTNVKVRGELLRLCNQPSHIESVFGVIPGEETGWNIGITCPGYNYNDSYKDFIKGFEVSESVEDLSLYPISNPQYISLEEVEVNEIPINCIKINTGNNTVFAGIEASYDKSILVDTGSDYEISFKIKGLQSGNSLSFKGEGYNFLGNVIDFLDIEDETETSTFIETNTLEGDMFMRGIVRHRLASGNLSPESLSVLKFQNGIEKISPTILIACNNDVYLYDIKIRVLPVTSVASVMLYNSELIVKLLESYNLLSREELVNIITTKLTPIHMVVSMSERDVDSEMPENKYLPYILHFDL